MGVVFLHILCSFLIKLFNISLIRIFFALSADRIKLLRFCILSGERYWLQMGFFMVFCFLMLFFSEKMIFLPRVLNMYSLFQFPHCLRLLFVGVVSVCFGFVLSFLSLFYFKSDICAICWLFFFALKVIFYVLSVCSV